MLTIRRSKERGHVKSDWLDSYHTFSFGEYYDPKNMQFRNLRVINHDLISAGKGFPAHSHRDMEILTYVLQGIVEHQDSMGNKVQIKPGEVQVMIAGTGVTHSEYNPDPQKTLELLQIWLLPGKRGEAPAYRQAFFSKEDKHNRLKLIASPDGTEGDLKIIQDARIYASVLDKEFQVRYEPKEGRGVWIQVAKGSIRVNKEILQTGDAVAADKEAILRIDGVSGLPAEFLLFDLK